MQYPSDGEEFPSEDGGSQPSPEEYELCKQYFEEGYALFLDFFSNLDTHLKWVVDDIHDYKEQDVMLEILLEMIVEFFGDRIFSEEYARYSVANIMQVFQENPDFFSMHLVTKTISHAVESFKYIVNNQQLYDSFYYESQSKQKLTSFVLYFLSKEVEKSTKKDNNSKYMIAYMKNLRIIVNNIAKVFYPEIYKELFW